MIKNKYQYDPLNRLTNMVDAVGTTVFAYAAGGELYTEDGPFASDSITNVYNSRLRTGLQLQQPTGVWTNGFGYDLAKRLTSVASPAGAFGYTYDASRLRLPVNLSLPNSSFITNVYDVNARLLSTKLVTSGASVLDAAEYGYNAGNQRTTFTNATGTNVSYLYDPIGQLTVADSAVNTEDRGYLYDAAWNLNRRTNNGVTATFSVDGLNQLTAIISTTYGYDGNGNLTSQTTPGPHGFTTGYTYDDENQLTSVTTGTGANPPYTAFVYDGLGRLREQTHWTWIGGIGGGGTASPQGGATTQSSGGGSYQMASGTLYIYDGNRVIQERDIKYNTPTVAYTRGNDLSGSLEGAGGIGGMLARSEGYYAGNFTSHAFYHADGNGNITYLEDGSQTLAANYRYDPYGNLLNSSGPLAADNTYRFSSKEWVPGVNGYYYLYRFYVPSLQRWPNHDPIGERGGLNLYDYVANNPINNIDPLGLWTFEAYGGWIFGGYFQI